MDISHSSLLVGIFSWFLQYFPKNSAILVQKLWGEQKLSKTRMALMAWPLVEELFFMLLLHEVFFYAHQ